MSANRVISRLVMTLVLCSLFACSLFQQGFRGPGSMQEDEFPAFENQLETDHFILKWTAKSSHTEDNIEDPAIVRETAGYLETAWGKYAELFGKTPYVCPATGKVEMVFHDLGCFGVADPPEDPIQFDARSWQAYPGIRQPTSAHELFHKLQYAYGYKTRWKPEKPYPWFTEGTAAWSEVFVWGRVSRVCKVDELFRDKNLDFHEAEEMAMPFWIFFVCGNHGAANHQLMVKLLEKYGETGDPKRALDDVVWSAYGPPKAFFARFAKERKNGFWEQCAAAEGNPYTCILGPDGNDIVGKLKARDGKGN